MGELTEDEIRRVRRMLWKASYGQLQGIIRDAQYRAASKKGDV